MIKLKERKVLGSGASRLVFEHPDDAGLLIKVMRPEVVEKLSKESGGPVWKQGRRRYGPYLSFQREVQEYLTCRAEADGPVDFLQEIVGFVDTDYGVGLIVKAVRGPDGGLAPTLMQLLKRGEFTDQTAAALERFFGELLESRVVVSDLNRSALVYRENDDAFTMIDGLALSNPIPIKGVSQWANRRSKLKRFEQMRQRIARFLGEAEG